MGWVLSKFRKKKSTMEVLTKLESDIRSIVEFKASTAQTQKKVVGHLVTYSIVIYLLGAIFAYFKLFPAARTTKDQLLLLLPFLVAPFLIWGLRRVLTWWYHRKIIKNEKKLELLKKEKVKILDEVMEKETYKVAKEILDKFGDKSHLQGPKPLPGMSAVFNKPSPGAGGDSQLRRRPLGEAGRPGLNNSLPVSSSGLGGAASKPGLAKLNSSVSVNSPRSGPGQVTSGPAGPVQPPSSRGQPPPLGAPGGQQRQPPTLAGAGGRSLPGPPLPRPILPRERGYLDKFVEFLVGDGPANRYALICRQCESHNGMALREEFEYIAFRCCYCYYWNPARKQRPVAPRLAVAAEKPAPSSESSGSDVSAPNSVPGSRRASVSKTEIKNEEVRAIGDSASQVSVKDECSEDSEEKTSVTAEPEQAEKKSEDVTTEQPEETRTEEISNSENEVESNNEAVETGFEHIKATEISDTVSDEQSKIDTNIGDIQSTYDKESRDSNENQMDIDS